MASSPTERIWENVRSRRSRRSRAADGYLRVSCRDLQLSSNQEAALRRLLKESDLAAEIMPQRLKLLKAELKQTVSAAQKLLSSLEAVDLLGGHMRQVPVKKDDLEDLITKTQIAIVELTRKSTKGPNGKALREWLVCGLVEVYEQNGARAAGSWSDDAKTKLGGPFFRFVECVWPQLPEEARCKNVDAFKRQIKVLLAQR